MTATASDALGRAIRFFIILRSLATRRQGRRVGRDELASACDCCHKTIARDIRALQSAGIPVDWDPAERTYLLADNRWSPTPAVVLGRADALALAVVRGLMTAGQPASPFSQGVARALGEVEAALSPAARRKMERAVRTLADVGGFARDYSSAPVAQLMQAAEERQTVEILYESLSGGDERRRLVDPYRVERHEGRYLQLQAWCHERQEVRTFALDRIREVRLTGTTFAPHEWDSSGEGVVGGLRGGHPISIEVRFDAVVATSARRRIWPFRAEFADAPDGGVILRGTVLGVEGITKELFSWRAHAEVLGGPELRAHMAKEARALAALYAGEP